MTRPKAGILGMGSYLPERCLTNADLEKMVDTSDEWIVKRTGIRERRIAADGEASSDMALAASRKALERAGVEPKDLDLILVGTVTPDTQTPSAACWLQAKLGAGPCAAFDISAACSGFIYGLSIAKTYVEAGVYRRVLVVGVEKLSSITNWTDRGTCVLFGDGAGAVVVGPVEDGRSEILSVYMTADGNDAGILLVPGGGSRTPLTEQSLREHQNTLWMEGREVFKLAVKVLADATLEALRMIDMPLMDLDWIVPHQANLRIITAMAERLKYPMERVYLNVDKTGNTSSASVILALDEAVQAGKIRPGQTVSLVAFGAGTTLAAGIVRI